MSPLRLIVAEDDPDLQSLLADTHEAVDLVISDVRMPMPNGVDALAKARAAGVEVPWVLISAFATDDVRKAARILSASVLDKPFLHRELEARVRASLIGHGDRSSVPRRC